MGPNGGGTYPDFDAFLASLSHDKRKKIRQERRKVADAGVSFRWSRGADIAKADWDFFYRCYERTYREHGNPPYLTRDFFRRMADTMPEAWLLFIAERNGKPMAASLIALSTQPGEPPVAYGRYWGRWNASTACTSRPATTSRWPGALRMARRASRAAHRASTRWRAR